MRKFHFVSKLKMNAQAYDKKSSSALAPLSILVIDEAQEFTDSIAETITTQKQNIFAHQIYDAHSLEEALGILHNEKIQILILGQLNTHRIVYIVSQLKKVSPKTAFIVVFDKDEERHMQTLIKKGIHEIIDETHITPLTLHKIFLKLTGTSKLYRYTASDSLEDIQRRLSKVTAKAVSSKDADTLDFKAIVSQSTDMTFVIDQNNRVVFANDITKTLTGLSLEKIKNHPLFLPILRFENQMFDKAHRCLSLEFIEFLSKVTSTFEVDIPLTNGEIRTMDLRITKVPVSNSEAYLLILHDITNIKHVAELTAQINEKSHLNHLKDEFLSIVSHEMRTPLTIVKGAISNLKDGIVGELTDEQQRILDISVRNVDRLARIINDLLDLSRLDSGKAKVQRKKMDLSLLIQELLQSFDETLQERNITTHIELPPTGAIVFADPDLIMQVMINLLENALRFTRSNITIQIHKENIKPGKSQSTQLIRVGVIDNGPGVPKDKIGVLFEKFEQVNRPSGGSGYKGTGLGLSICRQIIQLHQGKIWVQSEENKGAQFYFLLPEYQDHDDFIYLLQTKLETARRNQTNLCLLVVEISNLVELQNRCAEKDLAWMYSEISKNIRNTALRRNDELHFRRATQSFAILLQDSTRSTAEKVSQRIESLTKECFCPTQAGKVYVTIKTGFSIYPDEGIEARQLLDYANQDCNRT